MVNKIYRIKTKIAATMAVIPMCFCMAMADPAPVGAPDSGLTVGDVSVATDGIATSGNAERAMSDAEKEAKAEFGYTRFWMDDLKDQKDTLTIKYLYNDEKEAISGAEISIIKIADLHVKNGDARYTVADTYKEAFSDVKFDELDKDACLKLAKEMKAKTDKYEQVATTDDKGVVSFKDLEHGLYLVVQTGREGYSTHFEYFEPFILSVPEPVLTEGNGYGSWDYEVEALPKTETIKYTPTPTPTPGHPTGDTSNIPLAALGFIGAASVIGIYATTTKRKTEE